MILIYVVVVAAIVVIVVVTLYLQPFLLPVPDLIWILFEYIIMVIE